VRSVRGYRVQGESRLARVPQQSHAPLRHDQSIPVQEIFKVREEFLEVLGTAPHQHQFQGQDGIPREGGQGPGESKCKGGRRLLETAQRCWIRRQGPSEEMIGCLPVAGAADRAGSSPAVGCPELILQPGEKGDERRGPRYGAPGGLEFESDVHVAEHGILLKNRGDGPVSTPP
jgi:hypothetical protein